MVWFRPDINKKLRINWFNNCTWPSSVLAVSNFSNVTPLCPHHDSVSPGHCCSPHVGKCSQKESIYCYYRDIIRSSVYMVIGTNISLWNWLSKAYTIISNWHHWGGFIVIVIEILVESLNSKDVNAGVLGQTISLLLLMDLLCLPVPDPHMPV